MIIPILSITSSNPKRQMALSPLGRITYSHTSNTWGGNRSGCASGAQSVQPEATPIPEEGLSLAPQVVFHADEIGSYLELVDALRAEGTIVEPAEEVEQAFFSVICCFACHLYSTIK